MPVRCRYSVPAREKAQRVSTSNSSNLDSSQLTQRRRRCNQGVYILRYATASGAVVACAVRAGMCAAACVSGCSMCARTHVARSHVLCVFYVDAQQQSADIRVLWFRSGAETANSSSSIAIHSRGNAGTLP